MPHSSLTIARPPEAVFAYLADLTRHGEWATHSGLAIVADDPGIVGVGARYRSDGHQLGRHLLDSLTITDYDPPRLLTFESTGQGGVWRHSFELVAFNGGTRVTKRMDATRITPMLRLLSPLIALFVPRRLHIDLERIRARIESN